MKVYGHVIPSAIIDHCLSQMEIHRGFTLMDLRGAIIRAAAVDSATAERAADRVLQRLRRNGAIAYRDQKWRVVEQAKTPSS